MTNQESIKIVQRIIAQHDRERGNHHASETPNRTASTSAPNSDTCVDCGRPSVTRDKLYCLQCLRERIKSEVPDVKKMPSEMKGRRAIPTSTLGGAPKQGDA